MNIRGMQHLIKNKFPVPESMFLFRKKSDLKKEYRERYAQESVWAVVGYDDRTKIGDHPYKAKSIGRSLNIPEKEIDAALIKVDKALDDVKIPLKNRMYLTCKSHNDKNTILSGHAFFDGEKIHLDLFKGNRPSGKDWSPNFSYEIEVKDNKAVLLKVDKELLSDVKQVCKDVIKIGKGAYLDFSKTDNGRLFYHDLYFMKVPSFRKSNRGESLRQLEKTYSREHSLIYCYIWMKSDYGAYGLEDVLFIREPDSNKVSVWYDMDMLNSVLDNIVDNINSKKGYIEKVTKVFNDYWGEISPYLMGKKEIGSLKELEHYYKNLCKWWSAMAVIVAAPDVEELSPKHKKTLLALRNKTQHYADDQDNLFIDFINQNMPELKEVAHLISPEELFSVIRKPLARAEINKIAKRGSGFFLFKNEVRPLSRLNATLKASGLELKKDTVEDVSEIKGSIGSRGNARGKVCKVLSKSDISKVGVGDIIVTEMTSPEYLPAMQKSAAIITDEGGITCHAAIVARELKKPCIIGTKIATRVLKDGMMVEVDAERGVVKIIK